MKVIFMSILLLYTSQAHTEQPPSTYTLSVLRKFVEERRKDACNEAKLQQSKENNRMEVIYRGAEIAYRDVIDLIDHASTCIINNKDEENK